MSTFLDRIKSSAPRAPVPVATPEWGECDGQVFVRRLSAVDRANLYVELDKAHATRGAAFHAFLVAACSCDKDGNRIFADAEWEALQHEPASAIDRVSEAADELNVISDASRERQKKTFAAAGPSGNISASPANAE